MRDIAKDLRSLGEQQSRIEEQIKTLIRDMEKIEKTHESLMRQISDVSKTLYRHSIVFRVLTWSVTIVGGVYVSKAANFVVSLFKN